jgi:cyclophilin family peptidyl-prolyl cis-trans isomerase
LKIILTSNQQLEHCTTMELNYSGIPVEPSLDFGGKKAKDGQGFSAFGKVSKGMDVVKKIQQLHPEQEQYFKQIHKKNLPFLEGFFYET